MRIEDWNEDLRIEDRDILVCGFRHNPSIPIPQSAIAELWIATIHILIPQSSFLNN